MNNPRRVTAALFAALLVSGACTLLLSRFINRHAEQQLSATIYYAAPAHPIGAGEVLRAADLRMLAWPAISPVQGAFARFEPILGRAALYPLDPGQPLLERALTAPGSGVGLASRIPDGKRAIALRSDEVVGVAGFLTPGSHVDVLVTFRADGSPDPITATVLEDVEILTTGQQAEPDPAGKPLTTTVVTLLLTPDQAQRALLASSQGTVHFGLRNNLDQAQAKSSPVQLSELGGFEARFTRNPNPPAALPVGLALGAARPRPALPGSRTIAPKYPAPASPAQVVTILGGGDARPDGARERVEP